MRFLFQAMLGLGIFDLSGVRLIWPPGFCLWRTVKYEDIYIRDYPSVPALTRGLEAYFRFYNHERYHQSLGYAVPAAVHFAVKEPELGTS